ncbi:radical SAM family heme chaperone HemW [Algicella marina]|uniref:Heme chaperone HemW n=1 Tax=Algicella marina TaxID=2683284 RepID=A0A6P1T4C4_9RHOB|nr:radical SAM family heme chaperone HemW [Algicella marina]QHQ36605.1 coproporphyrinogen III oxidase [Algicella marina]
MVENWEEAGFGIYVHWPFCESKCPYCDFNSHVRAETDHARWRRALLDDLRMQARQWQGRVVSSVFFGGGTPSLMEPETVAAIIAEIGQLWRLSPDIEITLEANPGSVEAGRFREYAAGGVNRVSLGVQSLVDTDLRRLGRLHSASEARAAFEIARTQFDRVSFDLIYARQDQDQASWQAELQEAAAMAVDHFSLYQLTLEPGTRFHELARRGKLRGLPGDDRAADMFLATRDFCERIGLPAYEVSNHARAGAECRHNLIYWRCGDYLGVGPGAVGFLSAGNDRHTTETERAPEAWLERVEQHGTGVSRTTVIPASDQAENYLLMSLRLREGMDITRYNTLNGATLEIRRLLEDGLVYIKDGHLIVPEEHVVILNHVIERLITD